MPVPPSSHTPEALWRRSPRNRPNWAAIASAPPRRSKINVPPKTNFLLTFFFGFSSWVASSSTPRNDEGGVGGAIDSIGGVGGAIGSVGAGITVSTRG